MHSNLSSWVWSSLFKDMPIESSETNPLLDDEEGDKEDEPTQSDNIEVQANASIHLKLARFKESLLCRWEVGVMKRLSAFLELSLYLELWSSPSGEVKNCQTTSDQSILSACSLPSWSPTPSFTGFLTIYISWTRFCGKRSVGKLNETSGGRWRGGDIVDHLRRGRHHRWHHCWHPLWQDWQACLHLCHHAGQ